MPTIKQVEVNNATQIGCQDGSGKLDSKTPSNNPAKMLCMANPRATPIVVASKVMSNSWLMSAARMNPCDAPKVFISEHDSRFLRAKRLEEIIAAIAATIIVANPARLKKRLERSSVFPSCCPMFSIC